MKHHLKILLPALIITVISSCRSENDQLIHTFSKQVDAFEAKIDADTSVNANDPELIKMREDISKQMDLIQQCDLTDAQQLEVSELAIRLQVVLGTLENSILQKLPTSYGPRYELDSLPMASGSDDTIHTH